MTPRKEEKEEGVLEAMLRSLRAGIRRMVELIK
jgi:hypothetical protein